MPCYVNKIYRAVRLLMKNYTKQCMEMSPIIKLITFKVDNESVKKQFTETDFYVFAQIVIKKNS